MQIMKVGSVLAVALSLAGCGAGEGIDAVDSGSGAEIGETREAISTWVNLDLINGWKAASNSVTPSVGIVNGIVTFRGALDGSKATDSLAFCLDAAKYSGFRTTDNADMVLRVAMANGSNGSLRFYEVTLPPGMPIDCAQITQDGFPSSLGANAKLRTSLDGVSYDRTYSDSEFIPYLNGWGSPYPIRGSDTNARPEGIGMFAKLVNGFVRFQAATSDGASNTLFKLPSGKGLIPGNPVYLPVDLCKGLGGQGRIVVQTNGNVDLVVNNSDSQCATSLDGLSFSMSSPASAKPLNLGNNWGAYSARAVRARNDNGVIRLEGAVKDGNAITIATLPDASWYPANTIYLVADAIGTSQRAQISISNTGFIKLVSPSLALAAAGLSFDGVSFHR